MSHATQGRLPYRALAGTRENVAALGPGWHVGLATDGTADRPCDPRKPRARQVMPQ